MNKILKECRNTIKLCNKAIEYNKELKRLYSKNSYRVTHILSELDKIDEKIQSKKSILSIIWTLVDDTVRNVIRDYDKLAFEKKESNIDFVVEKGIMINTSIKESMESVIPLISRTLEKIKLDYKNDCEVF